MATILLISDPAPNEKLKRKFYKSNTKMIFPFQKQEKRVEPPVSDPSKNSYATISKPHQWTNNITPPNNFRSEEEWIAHTIESLFKRLDAIKAQKSSQHNTPSTSSATRSNVMTLSMPAPEQRNEPTNLNTSSATQSITPPDTSAAENVDDEMDYTTVSTKRSRRHDSSDEEPNSPRTKKPASGSPASGQDGTPVQKGREGGIYQRSLPSLLTLLDLEEGSPVREIRLPDGIPDLQPTQRKDPR